MFNDTSTKELEEILAKEIIKSKKLVIVVDSLRLVLKDYEAQLHGYTMTLGSINKIRQELKNRKRYGHEES